MKIWKTNNLIWLILILISSLPLAAQEILSLDAALNIARENSPSLQHAKLNLERSNQLLAAQQSKLKSQIRLTLDPFSYRKERQFTNLFSTWNTIEEKRSSGLLSISQPILLTDGTFSVENQLSWRDASNDLQNTSSETYSNNLYLSYNQPLFTYNRLKLQTNELELDLENSSLNFQLQNLQLEQQVSSKFYEVFRNKMQVQIASEDMRNKKESLEIIRNKVEALLTAREELYQAELNYANSQSSVQNAEVTLQNSKDEFKELIGFSLMDEIDIVANVEIGDPIPVDLQKAIEIGLQERIELRNRKIDIIYRKNELERSAATNEFKGNLNFTYGIIGNDEDVANVYETPTRNQNFSVSLEVPLWDWGEKKSRIKASQASLDKAELSLKQERNNIIISIRRAYRNILNQVEQLKIARQNVKMANLTYEINLERYRNGDLTSMDLNLYQNQLSQKKNDQISAMIQYKLAILDLKLQSMFDFEKNEKILDWKDKSK